MARQLVISLTAKADELTKGLDKATKATQSTADKIKGASLKAGVAITALGAGLTKLGGPLKESRLRLEQTARNAGLSADEFAALDKELDKTRRAMQKSGHSTAETNEALNTLMLSTGDAAQAKRALAAADELAATKGISLASATDQINRMMAGGKKLVNEFGLAIEDGADPLDALMEKIEGNSAALESTFEGRMQAAKVIALDFAASIGAKVGPALTALGPALMAVGPLMNAASAATKGLRGALTLLAAHPLLLAIMAGGAIIVALVLLEQKFGLVSNAVSALGGAFRNVWPAIKSALNMILWGVEVYANSLVRAITTPLRALSRIPGVGSIIPDVPRISLPRLHTGGVVPGPQGQPVPIMALGGEPFGRNAGGGNPIVINVAGSVISERDLADTVRDALTDLQRRGGTLAFA